LANSYVFGATKKAGRSRWTDRLRIKTVAEVAVVAQSAAYLDLAATVSRLRCAVWVLNAAVRATCCR
jgi:hypothetical protein